MEPVFDLKTVVRDLAETLQAIYEPDGTGYSIEVPLPNDRYQSVSLFVNGDEVELLTVVHELDRTAQSTVDRYARRAKDCKVSLEPEPEEGVYRVTVRAARPAAGATRDALEPLLVEVARLGDGIERELTGGDVD